MRHTLGLPFFYLAAGCIGTTEADTQAPCSGQTSCPVAVSEVLAECGEAPPGLTAVSDSPGAVAVQYGDVQTGCCPQSEVTAAVDLDLGELTFTYDLSDDACDCICEVDLSFVLSGLPPGPLTLRSPDGATALVQVL